MFEKSLARVRRSRFAVAATALAASDRFAPNKTGTINCGFACHTRVAAKDYIFTAYGKR